MSTITCENHESSKLANFHPEILRDKHVQLKWSTDFEINIDYFTIERSNNLKNWEIIGFEESSGNSNKLTTYEFTDHHPYSGTSYYRLKQTDFEGVIKYLKTTSIITKNMENFRIESVERKKNTVQIKGNFQKDGQLFITNQMGNVIFEHLFEENNNQIEFPVQNNVRVILLNYKDNLLMDNSKGKILIQIN